MKIAGSANLKHNPEQVFAALTDPAVLARTLPGCQSLEQVGPDAYKMVITAGVASIKGSYLGQVELSEKNPPHSFLMRAEGSGAPGTIRALVRISIAADGEGTLLSYDADAEIGGVIAGVGQRVLGGVAKKMAGEFFSGVDRHLSGGVAPAPKTQESQSIPAPTPTIVRQSAPPAATQVVQSSNLAAMTMGAAIALIGVVIGWLISH